MRRVILIMEDAMKINCANVLNRLPLLCAILLAAHPALAGNAAFTYDALDRVTHAVTGDGAVTDYSYDAAGNRTSHVVQAAITKFALTVAKGGSGSGTISGSGSGSYPTGSSITLTATAAAGSTFAGWNTSPCDASFVMPATDLTCIATFTLNTYALVVNKAGTGSGTVVGGGNFAASSQVTLAATADAGSAFTGWSPSPCAASFAMPAAGLTCTATFRPALVIQGYRQVNRVRSSRTEYEYSYEVTAQNQGGALAGARLVLDAPVPAGMTVLDGVLNLGNLAAGASGKDRFSFRQDASQPLKVEDLHWSFAPQ